MLQYTTQIGRGSLARAASIAKIHNEASQNNKQEKKIIGCTRMAPN